MQTLRQSQREAGISALEGTAHWPEQLQEPNAVTEQLPGCSLTVPLAQESQVKLAHTGP